MRFTPNPMKYGVLDVKLNSLILLEISPPSKKSQRSHFRSLKDLGVKSEIPHLGGLDGDLHFRKIISNWF